MTKLSLGLAFALGCSGSSKPVAPPAPPDQGSAAAISTAPAESGPPGDSHDRMKTIAPDALAWSPLDPELGDKGPQLAPAWGDRESEPSGFFLQLPAGYTGALATHANDYHAVTISGATTNAQSGAKKSAPVPPGAYWYQPGGVAHATSCGKEPCIVYVHTTGRLAIAPAQPAKGAKPDPRYVEKKPKDLTWTAVDPKNPALGQAAALWGDAESQPSGMFVKLPAGNAPTWHIHKHDYHAVVLAGTVINNESGSEPVEMPVGSYWWQPGGYKHAETCKAGGPDCIFYVHHTGAYLWKSVD